MSKFLHIFDNLLSVEECRKYIEKINSSKLDHVNRGNAEYYRLEEDIPELAKKLWLKIKDHIPTHYNNKELTHLNPHFRFSKYEPGMEFSMHRDGINQDQTGSRSIMTLNIFLNDNFEGGSTDFFNEDDSLFFSAKPLQGSAALFDRMIKHCGCKVSTGHKYLMRTDVMSR